MKEIRKNQTLQIELRDRTRLDGIVLDVSEDRVLVLIAYESLDIAKKLNELDKLLISVKTHMGIKLMFSHIIESLNANNCLIIENSESIPIQQKREFVRVCTEFKFKVIDSNNDEHLCLCDNISAGGVAFRCLNRSFSIGETIKIIFPYSKFGKDIICISDIIKSNGEIFVAKYNNINSYDEDRIVKYVFKMIAKNQ